MITHQDNGLRSIVMSKTIITVQHTESEHHLNGHAGAWVKFAAHKEGASAGFWDRKMALNWRLWRRIHHVLFRFDPCSADLWNRIEPFCKQIVESPDEKILVVSHGCTLSFLQAMLMKFRFEYEAFIKIYNLRFPEDWDVDEDYRFDISPVMI